MHVSNIKKYPFKLMTSFIGGKNAKQNQLLNVVLRFVCNCEN